MIKYVIKRDGSKQPFVEEKIKIVIGKALDSVKTEVPISVEEITQEVLEEIKCRLDSKSHFADTVGIEFIQDCVEDTLMDLNLKKTVKAYIIYRYENKKNKTISNV